MTTTTDGENTAWAGGAGETTPDSQSQRADDNTLLLTDDEQKIKYLNSCRKIGAKSLRYFRRTEGSFSMDSEHEDSDPPPAYTSGRTTTSPNNNNNDDDPDGKKRRRRRGSNKTLCRRLMKLVKSLGGQAAMLLAYTFLGAWMMMTIEGPREDAQRQEVSSTRERMAFLLKNSTVALLAGVINDTDWDRHTHDTLLSFEDQVHRSGVSSTSKKKWTFFGSVLFCFTTYTTIGYGNIAPATKTGRIATMLYATLGIPLALIVLADLGRRFAIAFKFIWGFIRRYYYTGYCRKMRDKVNKTSYDMADSAAATSDCERGQNDSVDIQRQGSYRKTEKSGHHVEADYREEKEGGGGDGGSTSSGRKEAEGRLTVKETRPHPQRRRSSPTQVARRRPSQDKDVVVLTGKPEPRISVIKPQEAQMWAERAHHDAKPSDDSTDHVDHTDINEEFQLPVPLAIGFIFAYIFLGAGMYILWEDWTYLESFYFVFITTSTIGFGDVLPEHPNFFLLSCVYTFLGLALVSMTVNVIMEFMSKTIDLAKQSMDEATERVAAKAKAARGKLSQMGSRAKRKVRKTLSRRKKKTKAKRSSAKRGIEVSDRPEHSDTDSDGAAVPKVQVRDTASTTGVSPSHSSPAANNVSEVKDSEVGKQVPRHEPDLPTADGKAVTHKDMGAE